MVSEFQQRKYEKMFNQFDANRDGVIEETDITAMAQSWCDTFGIAPRSEGWSKVYKTASKMWRDLQGSMDTSGDKKVTMDEWIASLTNPDFVETAAVPFSVAVFDIADKDGDGQLTFEEWSAAFNTAGLSDQEARQVFDKMDTDDDGHVEREEFAQATKDFYLSDDPNAAGNLLAGRL
jgi:Ca2+-binding EF-hand superfamily protein